MTNKDLQTFKQMKFRLLAIDRVWDLKMIDEIVDLIDTAVAYWASDNSEDAHELPLLFVLTKDDSTVVQQTFRVDLATIASGINRILSGSCPVNVDVIGNVAKFVATNSLDHLDTDDMDAIVQAGVYGELKWG